MSQDDTFISAEYPDALARVWASLTCPTSGEVLLSAAPGYEFLDWGGAAHVGGGSHGSLHASDSLGALVLERGRSGSAASNPPQGQWSIRDIAPIVRAHFGLDPPEGLSGPNPPLPSADAFKGSAARASIRAADRLPGRREHRRPSPLRFTAGPVSGSAKTASTASAPQVTIAEAPVPVPASALPPPGRRLSANRVLAIAEALPKMRAVRRKYPGSYGGAYLKGRCAGR